MGDTNKPKTFLLATAKDGRLRFQGLPSSGSWDPDRLTHVTYWPEQDLETRDFRERSWVVLSAAELEHVLAVSHGIPARISLLISETLLRHARNNWEGSES